MAMVRQPARVVAHATFRQLHHQSVHNCGHTYDCYCDQGMIIKISCACGAELRSAAKERLRY